MTDVTIQNDLSFLFLQWLGWDYNFWTVLFAHIILLAGVIATIFIIGLIGMLLDMW